MGFLHELHFFQVLSMRVLWTKIERVGKFLSALATKPIIGEQGVRMFLVSALISVSAHAAMTQEFACYQVMNQKARSANVILDDKIAIHPIDKYAFFKITGKGIQKCRVPANAPIAPDGKDGVGPWLMKFVYQKEHYHIQYPEVREHLDIKGAPPWVTPECTSSAASAAKILENRIADSRQACAEGPQFKPCLKDFFENLKSCEGIPAIKTYVEELERTSPTAGTAAGTTSPAEIGR